MNPHYWGCDDSLSLDSKGMMGSEDWGLGGLGGEGEDSKGGCLVLQQNLATTKDEWCSDRRGTHSRRVDVGASRRMSQGGQSEGLSIVLHWLIYIGGWSMCKV